MAGGGETSEFGDAAQERARRKRLVDEPGPSWREYFYRSFARVWALCFFFIADVWVVVQWLYPWMAINLAWILIALAIAIYAEYLAYQCLWFEPDEASRSTRQPFRRTWNRPVEYGRWSEAREEARRHPASPAAVDPSEFL
ncbi:MAG TPA: hypothetical protein VEL82_07580 [Thermoplasmata archaeon]|nr:hypothetical protein [Thermoplasmata archaeon]